MDYPNCNQSINPTEKPDGSLAFACGHCGWGQDRLVDSGDDAPAELEPVNWGKLAAYWTGALIVVFGPYIALRIGVPLAIAQAPGLEDHIAMDRVMTMINMHYWWIMALYVTIAALITPSVDRDNMGLGGTWIDNPFSFDDDYNRAMFKLAIFLLPGKVVWIAIRNTYYVLTMK